MIQYYHFGEMVIDGMAYHNDLIIFPDHLISDWRRQSGHILRSQDIPDVFDQKPDILIIGTGRFGRMTLSDEFFLKIKSLSIELHATNTIDAVVFFNRCNINNKIGAFHLTC